MQTVRRLKPFNASLNDGDAQPELPFEMVDKIYSYLEALSLCILSMTCKKMSNRRPNEKDLEMALKLRAKERLLERLNGVSNGLGEALTHVLEEGNVYMTGEFLFNCVIKSAEVDTVDIVIKTSVTDGDRLRTFSLMHKLLIKMDKAFRKRSLSCSLKSEDKPSVELKCMGVLRCCLVTAHNLNIRVIVMNSHDFFQSRELDIQCMLKRLYKFSLFECCYDGSSFYVNKMANKLKKIGKTRNGLFENRMGELEQEYDNYDALPEGYTFKKLEEENKCLMRQVRSSLSVVANRYKALGYHIEEK